MGLKSFAILLLKHWISMLRGGQNILEAIKCPSWQRLFLKIWKDHEENENIKIRKKDNEGKDNEEKRKLHVKQRNYCASLLRKTEKAYHENLDERNVSDSKLF